MGIENVGYGCVSGPGITICSPRGFRYRAVRDCPTCQHRRRFLVTVFEWYDAEWVCCACGDRWSGGERAPRPFARGRRKAATQGLAQAWREAGTGVAARSWLMAALTTQEPSSPGAQGPPIP